MKKDLKKLIALLLFGAAALSGCAIDNRGHRGRYDNRYYHDRYNRNNNDNRYHHYNNY